MSVSIYKIHRNNCRCLNSKHFVLTFQKAKKVKKAADRHYGKDSIMKNGRKTEI